MSENYLDEIIIDGIDETYAVDIDVDEVESANIMLVDEVIDGSASMYSYENVMADCLEHQKASIIGSKQSDEMLIAKTIFSDDIQTGGYVSPEDFNTDYYTDTATRLYDAIIERRQHMLNYMEDLVDNGTNVRACMVILSDGLDNVSRNSISDARAAIQDLLQKEIIVAFIAFGQQAHGIADKLGVPKKNVIEATNDEHELRRLMALVSKSAISASKKASAGALGSDDGFFDV